MNLMIKRKEVDYRMSMIILGLLLCRGYLSAKEYETVRKKLLKKYQPPLGELW